jgi:hypothetical protein
MLPKQRTPRKRGSYIFASVLGQSKSLERYEVRQGEHDAALGVEHKYQILDRAAPGKALDVAEESQIRLQGGLKKEGGALENKRHQMSEERYRTAGGTVDR